MRICAQCLRCISHDSVDSSSIIQQVLLGCEAAAAQAVFGVLLFLLHACVAPLQLQPWSNHACALKVLLPARLSANSCTFVWAGRSGAGAGSLATKERDAQRSKGCTLWWLLGPSC